MSIIGSNSLGIALVAGKNLVPDPATGKTAFLTFDIALSLYNDYKIVINLESVKVKV